jgi:4-hydroxybenzoate polyprenyltransferase
MGDGAIAVTALTRAGVYLRLGRVSNLPTVWTNVLVGAFLSGGAVGARDLIVLLVALSSFYIAGMFLNDAFDRDFDQRHRPERPIPAGLVSSVEVFAVGFALIVFAVALVGTWGFHVHGRGGLLALACAVALAGAIVLYDAWHKANPASPLLMGLCRVLVYCTSSAMVASALPWPVALASLILLAYLIGLTWTARQEDRGRLARWWPVALLAAPLVATARSWSDPVVLLWAVSYLLWTGRALLWMRQGGAQIGRAVGALIAGICWVDALLLAQAGWHGASAIAAVGWAATLSFQRYIKGT